MSLLEKLFIGFWICHTCEWLYGSFKSGKEMEKFIECRVKEIERLEL